MKEIVIKIPDYLYERICKAIDADVEYYYVSQLDRADMYKAIRDGEVLPKGHGELRDTKTIVYKLNDTDIYLTDDDWNEIGKALQSAEVLVEADKEGEE